MNTSSMTSFSKPESLGLKIISLNSILGNTSLLSFSIAMKYYSSVMNPISCFDSKIGEIPKTLWERVIFLILSCDLHFEEVNWVCNYSFFLITTFKSIYLSYVIVGYWWYLRLLTLRINLELGFKLLIGLFWFVLFLVEN